MRFVLLIATILFIAEYSNLVQLFGVTEADTIVVCYDSETEEEKKTEKDSKKCKFEKFHYYYEYSYLLSFFSRQKRYLHQTGICLKGHCPIFGQPPDA